MSTKMGADRCAENSDESKLETTIGQSKVCEHLFSGMCLSLQQCFPSGQSFLSVGLWCVALSFFPLP